MFQNTDKRLCLDIHSLVTIVAPDMPVTLINQLTAYLGLFVVQDKPQAVDIMLLPQVEESQFIVPDSTVYNFWVTEYQGQQAITFIYRGEANITIVFSDCLKIFYRTNAKIAEQLYSVLLYCIHLVLVSKKSLLFHGALAVSGDNNEALILTGPRGSKKTLLLLKLLRDGWHYVSDDKFIFNNKNAYLFQSFINICEHHRAALPWLSELNPAVMKLNRWHGLRKTLKRMAVRYLPSYLLPSLQRYYDKSLILPITSIFKNVKTINVAKPNRVVVLAFGPNFELKPVSARDILSDIVTIQSLPFCQFYWFDKILSLINPAYSDKLQAIITDNMQDLVFFKLTIPYDYDINLVYNEMKQCLNAVS